MSAPGFRAMARALERDIEAEINRMNEQRGPQRGRIARIAAMRRELARVRAGKL